MQLALAGWITLAVLEHYTRHALGIWTALGVSVLAVSFAPIALAGASPSTKAALSLIHLWACPRLVLQQQPVILTGVAA